MSEMVWRIQTETKGHVVGYKAGAEGGDVLLDSNIVTSKDLSYMGVLVKMSFAVEDKPARVQCRSLLNENWKLVYESKVYTPPERAGLTIKIQEA